MTLVDLFDEIRNTKPPEIRKDDEDYLELVVPTHSEKALCMILERFFGPPFKPRNVAPNEKARAITSDYGGIENHQVLYYLEKDGLSHCAMIWPWNSGERATIKIARGIIPACLALSFVHRPMRGRHLLHGLDK